MTFTSRFACHARRLWLSPRTFRVRRRRKDEHGWRHDSRAAAAEYRKWIKSFDRLNRRDRAWIERDVARWPDRPSVTAVVALADGSGAIDAGSAADLGGQVYPFREILVAVRASDQEKTRARLDKAGLASARIVACAGDLSEAGMQAVAFRETGGELCIFPDLRDRLLPSASYLAAHAFRHNRNAAFLYPDEDRLDAAGRRERPFFKPERLGEIALAVDITGPATVFSVDKLKAIGGPAAEAGRAWRWDMVLRLLERFDRDGVCHIPYVTVSRRSDPDDASRLLRSGRDAVASHLDRSGTRAEVDLAESGQHLAVRYAIPEPPPLVTAIVATRDRTELLRRCLAGLLHGTDYPTLEVIVIDNDSQEAETLRYLDSLSLDRRVRVIRRPGPFNYSQLHNDVVPHARGDILALINNDIEIIEPKWLTAMVVHAARPSVGVVGAKLLYPAGKIQHAGVVLGLSGGAGHIFRGMSADYPGPHHLLDIVQNLAAVTAACMVLRRSVYEEAGGMDPLLAVEFNDIDLCLRIRERGYEIVWTPEAKLIHLESMSRGRNETEAQKERALGESRLMDERWKAWMDRDPYFSPNLSLRGPHRRPAFPPRILPPWLEQSEIPG
jgi:GT2 family glycosyltransferase